MAASSKQRPMLHASVLGLGKSDLTADLDLTYSTSSGATDFMIEYQSRKW